MLAEKYIFYSDIHCSNPYVKKAYPTREAVKFSYIALPNALPLNRRPPVTLIYLFHDLFSPLNYYFNTSTYSSIKI